MAKGQKSKYGHIIDGSILLGIGVVFMLILCGVFGKAGAVISNFLIGVFGYVIYAYMTAMILIGVLRLFNVSMPRTKLVKLLSLLLACGMVISLFHVMSSSNLIGSGYGEYLKGCYIDHNTAGGILGGIFVYPLLVINYYFALVAFAILAIVLFGVVIFYDAWLKDLLFGKRNKREEYLQVQKFDGEEAVEDSVNSEVRLNVYDVTRRDVKKCGKNEEFTYTSLAEENTKPIDLDGLEQPVADEPVIVEKTSDNTLDSINEFFAQYKKGIITPIADDDKPNITRGSHGYDVIGDSNVSGRYGASDSTVRGMDSRKIGAQHSEDNVITGRQNDSSIDKMTDNSSLNATDRETVNSVQSADTVTEMRTTSDSVEIKIIKDNIDTEPAAETLDIKEMIVEKHTPEADPDVYRTEVHKPQDKVEDLTATHDDISDLGELLRKKKAEKEERDRQALMRGHGILDGDIPTAEEVRQRAERNDKGGTHQMGSGIRHTMIPTNVPKLDVLEETKTAEVKAEKPKLAPYKFPPVSLLRDYYEKPQTADIDEKIESLKQCLEAFKINASVQDVIIGPTFTRIELQMQMGCTVSAVEKYENDIAMVLQVKNMRMEIPIPGKNAFGIEIPNAVRSKVGLKEIITDSAFSNTKQKLSFALGKDCDGKVFVEDLTTMPHLLMAGATGAGKSVCLNSLLCSIVYKYTPDYVRFLLIDPKQVELTSYDNIPHMLIPNAISDKGQALNALDWAIDEMELRYSMFRDIRVKNMSEYNAYQANHGKDTIPYIVIVVDEVGDYMVAMKKELEARIVRLTQKARAAGIILILATQRPSVDVITGTIKANLPSRIAFGVVSNKDSITILDVGGAEKLLRYGDMLYKNSNATDIARVQGTLVDTEEVNAICDYIRDNNEVYFDPDIIEAITKTKEENSPSGGVNMNGNDNSVDNDPKFVEVLLYAVEQGVVSISAIQRRFGYGFPKAARLVDVMEQRGFVAPGKDGKKKEVLLDMETFRQMYGDTEIGGGDN